MFIGFSAPYASGWLHERCAGHAVGDPATLQWIEATTGRGLVTTAPQRLTIPVFGSYRGFEALESTAEGAFDR